MSEEYQRIELITGAARRRHWSTERKLRLVYQAVTDQQPSTN